MMDLFFALHFSFFSFLHAFNLSLYHSPGCSLIHSFFPTHPVILSCYLPVLLSSAALAPDSDSSSLPIFMFAHALASPQIFFLLLVESLYCWALLPYKSVPFPGFLKPLSSWCLSSSSYCSLGEVEGNLTMV